MHRLDSLAGGTDQWVQVRLYDIPVDGTCLPEEHATCGFYYLLGVTSAAGGIGAFRLGWLGEITSIQWLPRTDDISSGRLRISVTNYPSWVFKSEPTIKRVSKQFELKVAAETIVVTELH
jgi:hypothetical protein